MSKCSPRRQSITVRICIAVMFPVLLFQILVLLFIGIRFSDHEQVDAINETIWMNQKGIAELFGVTVPNVSYHFKNIFGSGELEPELVIKEFLITAQSGARGISTEKVKFYNLDAIIAVGYRINSKRAT